jgi:hypothetical protein
MTLQIGLLFFALVVCFLFAMLQFANIIGLVQARGVPYVPLSRRQLRAIAENVKIAPDRSVVDLGSGDGRVLRMFERQGIKNLTGYELNLWPFVLAKTYNFFRRSKTKIFLKNFTPIDIGQFEVVFCYLLPKALLDLRSKFDRELKPGSQIISYGFEITDWRTPKMVYHTNKNNPNIGRIFVYEI